MVERSVGWTTSSDARVASQRGPRRAWLAWGLAGALVAPWIAGAARAQVAPAEAFFTKRVEQLTGWSGAGRVGGQDSAVALPNANGDGVDFWFGDTWSECQLIPNTMATSDADASDGLSLAYYADAGGRALPPLARDPTTGEITVWLEAPFRREGQLCVFYYMVPPSWPYHAPGSELGAGVACTTDGSPPLVRLGTNVLPDHPHLLGPKSVLQIGSGWLIFFVNEMVGGLPGTFLAWSRKSSVDDFSSYTYWTGHGWSSKPGDRVHVLSNLSPPSVAWNDHLGAWVATGSIVLSPDGISGRFGLATASSFIGPWSETIPLYGESGGGRWGSVYNAFHTDAFDQEGGRRMFTTATHSSRYNVDLFETDVGHAESRFCLASPDDDAVQLEGRTPATAGPSLRLAPGSRSVIGLRLTGASWVQGAEGLADPLLTPSVEATSLVLPLAAQAVQSFEAKILVRVGAPNASAWEAGGDLFGMSAISEVVVDVPVTAGATEIRIGNDVAAMFTAAIRENGWRPGYDNVVPITLTRLDEYPLDLELASQEGGGGGEAWLCHGACPPAPTLPAAACRPPREFVAHDCGVRGASSSCGLGGEIALLLPLLALLRGRRKNLPGPV